MKTSFRVLIALAFSPAVLLANTVYGTVTTGANPSTPVVGAKVVASVFSSGGPHVDSTYTDSLGQYSVTIPYQYGGVTILATGYYPADMSLDFGMSKTPRSRLYNFNLVAIGTNVTGSISGTVTSGGIPVAGALVVLNNLDATGTRVIVDSLRTDSLGWYLLDSEIARSGYILTVQAAGYQAAYQLNVVISANTNTLGNFELVAVVPVIRHSSSSSRFSLAQFGGRIVLDLGAMPARFVEVYSPNGALRLRVPVPAGASRVEFPAEITSAQVNLLRVR